LFMATPLKAMASTALFIFGKNAMGEHMLFHNRHIRIMLDIPVEPAARRLALLTGGVT
jgi:hypothetical protein